MKDEKFQGKVLDSNGQIVGGEQDKAKALSKALTGLAMHAHLHSKKLDEDLLPIPKIKLDEQISNVMDAIDDEPGVTLFMAFGLYIAMNPEDVTGISQDDTGEAFNRFMKILNSIEPTGEQN